MPAARRAARPALRTARRSHAPLAHQVHLKIACRAVDGDFNGQPEHMHQVWNVLGVQCNHWPRATLTIDPKLRAGAAVVPATATPPQ